MMIVLKQALSSISILSMTTDLKTMENSSKYHQAQPKNVIVTTWILNKSWYFQGVFELFCVMNKSLARFSFFLTLPMWFVCCRNQLMGIKRKCNCFGIFQKQIKQIKNTSLEDRSSLWNNFCSIHCKDRARFSLDENSLAKRVFGWSSSEIHIFGYTDPFFMRFFSISLSIPTD